MGGKRKRKRVRINMNTESATKTTDENASKLVNEIFSKKFVYTCTETDGNWLLPVCDIFTNDPWECELLAELKNELNAVKTSLSNFDITKWHTHTQETNPSGRVISSLREYIHPELCTQAWCKFHEIICAHPIVSQNVPILNSLHICEAPGAFITSLNHYLKSREFNGQWFWMGNTLNPYYEGNDLSKMIDDDRLIVDTLDRWLFGVDNTGDIMNNENVCDLREKASFMQPIMLVTADGSIDCQNMPDQQETITAHLHFCEAIAALNVLAVGGSFVLKMFTLFEHQSICLIYLLNSTFKKVTVMKPATSKPGNSEVYIVCLDYQGMEKMVLETLLSFVGPEPPQKALFGLDQIPKSFLEQHQMCCKFFSQRQINTIEENKRQYMENTEERKQHLLKIRTCCALSYQQRFNIKRINSQQYVVPRFKSVRRYKKQKLTQNQAKGRHEGSYNQRIDYNQLSWHEKIQRMDKYNLADDVIDWFASPYSADEYNHIWPIIQGKPVNRIVCSKFCDNKLLQQYNELLDNIKPVTTDSTRLQLSTINVCSDCKKCAKDQIRSLNDRCSCNLETHGRHTTGKALSECAASDSIPVETPAGMGDVNIYDQLWYQIIDSTDQDILNIVSCSDTFSTLQQHFTQKVKQQPDLEKGRNIIIADWIKADPKENNESQESWTHFYAALKKLKEGDHLAFPMNSCLLRFSAGIAYIIYCTFSKIGVFVCSVDDVIWFIALDYQGCPSTLADNLKELDREVCCSSEKTILQFVPMQNLLGSFHAFLSTVNDRNLTRRINSMLDKYNYKDSN